MPEMDLTAAIEAGARSHYPDLFDDWPESLQDEYRDTAHRVLCAALPHIIEALRAEADLDAGINVATVFSGGAGTPVDAEAWNRWQTAVGAVEWLTKRAEKKNDTQVITPL